MKYKVLVNNKEYAEARSITTAEEFKQEALKEYPNSYVTIK